MAQAIAALYRTEWGRIVAILIRLVGDFDVAEEAAQAAFTAAVNQWESDGIQFTYYSLLITHYFFQLVAVPHKYPICCIPLLSLSGRLIARSLIRQSIQAILLGKNGCCICY
ncbi:MAG: hypothetical protein RMY34_34630 [Aulosira sp. DedQUE10]|nr:hypothetical protein [Aulosira sp. DedQUE10]